MIDLGIIVLQRTAEKRTSSQVIPSIKYYFQNRLHLIKSMSCQSTLTHYNLEKIKFHSHQYQSFWIMTQGWKIFEFQRRCCKAVHPGVFTQSHQAIIGAHALLNLTDIFSVAMTVSYMWKHNRLAVATMKRLSQKDSN